MRFTRKPRQSVETDVMILNNLCATYVGAALEATNDPGIIVASVGVYISMIWRLPGISEFYANPETMMEALWKIADDTGWEGMRQDFQKGGHIP